MSKGFHGKTYLYPTPNNGEQEIGVITSLEHKAYVVGFIRDNGTVERVLSASIPCSPGIEPAKLQQRLDNRAAKLKLKSAGKAVIVRECMEATQVLPPDSGTDLPHSPAEVTSQYRLAVGGALEMVRFGSMLMDIDDALAKVSGKDPNGRRGDESLRGWIEANCPDVNYKTAMRFKILAEGVQRTCNVPAKISLSLAMPGPDGQTVMPQGKCPIPPTRLEKIQADVWDLVNGRSARQLMFDFAAAEPKPKGGANHTEKLSAEEKHAKAVADAKAVWTSGVADLVDNAKRLKTHLLLDTATISGLLLKLDVIRDYLTEAKGKE